MRAELHVAVAVAVAVAVLVATGDEPCRAGVGQGPHAWTPFGQVSLDKNGCGSCPATFPTPSRYRSFGLATDSPYAVTLNGRIDVTCADGGSYNVALRSAVRGGIFQQVPNSCVNLDSKEIKLTITSVSLSPPDAERTVALTAYGRLP